jgi:hypothetical protein
MAELVCNLFAGIGIIFTTLGILAVCIFWEQ